MHVYLMRHGIAYEQSEWSGGDDSRPLTDEGLQRTRDVHSLRLLYFVTGNRTKLWRLLDMARAAGDTAARMASAVYLGASLMFLAQACGASVPSWRGLNGSTGREWK